MLWAEQGAPRDRSKQVWFAGVHSNVGGGYPRQGMSLEPLEWMMSEAHAQGLRFVQGDRENYYIHADVNDKMHDPRAGLGIFYRWQPRDVDALRAGIGAGPALVHRSVFERIAREHRVATSPVRCRPGLPWSVPRCTRPTGVSAPSRRTSSMPTRARGRSSAATGHSCGSRRSRAGRCCLRRSSSRSPASSCT